MAPLSKEYNISEIFYSIQGEGNRAGLPCVFVRLQGCRLRCSWCDTPYALDVNQVETLMTGDQIIKEIKKYDCNFIEFTGGEPLEQQGVAELMSELCNEDYTVAVETSGYISLKNLDSRIIKILDIKCPDSKMHKKNDYDNINYLSKNDEVKFVIASRTDFEWAINIIKQYNIFAKTASILISPAFGLVSNIELAEWILAESLPVKMQVQMHKYIWDPNKRGV